MTLSVAEYYVIYFGVLFAAGGVGIYLLHLSGRRLDRLEREAREARKAHLAE